MNSRKIGKTWWIEVVGGTWKPATSKKFTISHTRGNGFVLWAYPNGIPGKQIGWFKTFSQAAKASTA